MKIFFNILLISIAFLSQASKYIIRYDSNFASFRIINTKEGSEKKITLQNNIIFPTCFYRF